MSAFMQSIYFFVFRSSVRMLVRQFFSFTGASAMFV